MKIIESEDRSFHYYLYCKDEKDLTFFMEYVALVGGSFYLGAGIQNNYKEAVEYYFNEIPINSHELELVREFLDSFYEK